MRFAILPLLLLISLPSRALPLKPLPDSQILLKVPYTMGTHEIKGSGFSGTVVVDPTTSMITDGIIELPVTNLNHEKETLVCHLQESLTLNYEQSDFPDDHVCEDDKLPIAGKNAPVYPSIRAELAKPTPLTAKFLPLKWTIHGVPQTIEVPVTLAWDAEKNILRAAGAFKLDRRKFNIIVKKFLFISVEDEITLDLSIILGAQ